MAKENYMIGLTDAQKRATMCLDDGIGFVDPKDNKIVMVWRPKYKPIPPETPLTQKPSGGNMSAFIFGSSKGSGRFMGSKKKHTIRGMKRR